MNLYSTYPILFMIFMCMYIQIKNTKKIVLYSAIIDNIYYIINEICMYVCALCGTHLENPGSPDWGSTRLHLFKLLTSPPPAAFEVFPLPAPSQLPSTKGHGFFHKANHHSAVTAC